MAKAMQVGRDEQAARMVAVIISAGLIVKGAGSCPSGEFTVGPYRRAVGPSGFALFGYGRDVPEPYQARESQSPIEVARLFVSCVGSSRAREAALRTPDRPAFSTSADDIARRKAEHARNCRNVFCRECRVA